MTFAVMLMLRINLFLEYTSGIEEQKAVKQGNSETREVAISTNMIGDNP